MELNVNLGKDSYRILIERGLLKRAAKEIREIYQGKKIAVISDDSVYAFYGESLLEQLKEYWECSAVILPHGEASKSIDVLPGVYAQLLEAGISRSDLIVALGGGVVGDLAGFAAATYLRGIPFVQIPTSLLAQVDSSVGGKVAVDLKEGKNLVGAFYQPKKVLIDPDVLKTLPERYIHDGMGEVIKYGCIKDAELFALLRWWRKTSLIPERGCCLISVIRWHMQWSRGSHMKEKVMGKRLRSACIRSHGSRKNWD